MAQDGMGQHGMGRDISDYIENLSPNLWLWAWLGSGKAEVCQFLYLVPKLSIQTR